MMNEEEKKDYRRKRNGWGWLIAAAWILFWWLQKTDGSITGGLNHFLMAVVSVVTAPFAFVVSHYLARAVVERQSAERARAEAEELEALRQHEAREHTNRLNLFQSEAQQTRDLIDRGEFIKKIGTVRDYIVILAVASDDKKRILIRQAIDKELRDLIVKHDPQAMAALVQRDEAVRISLSSMLEALSQLGPLSADAAVLQCAQSQQRLSFV